MFCTTCGNQIRDDARFCTKCGAKVENVSASNNKVISLDCSNSKKKFDYSKNKMLLIGAITSVAIIGILFVCIMLHSSLSKIHIDYIYNSDGTACVTGIKVGKLVEDKEDLHIDIPDTVKKRGKEYSVVEIGQAAFFNGCDELTIRGLFGLANEIKYYSPVSIELPDSITSIEDAAFFYCSSLESIELPDSITSIVDSAFYNCSSLESIELPDSITSIGDSAFSGCSSLESIEFPDSLTNIGENAFYNCSSLESIELPDSITSIGDSAFSGCSSLESIEFPDSLTNIGENAFENCIGLTSIEFPSNLTTIGGTAFTEYKEINNPEELFSEIIDKAFAGCIELEYIGFPNGMDLSLTSSPRTDEERYGGFSDSDDEMDYEDEVDSNGYKRSDFVSEGAYRDYLNFGDLWGLK